MADNAVNENALVDQVNAVEGDVGAAEATDPVSEEVKADVAGADAPVAPVGLPDEAKAAQQRAALLAAQFAAHHESDAIDPASGKRRPEFEENDEPAAKRLGGEGAGGGEMTVIIQVPCGKVGKLIGKSGVTIQAIQSRGQTKMKVEHDAVGDCKPVHITGTAENIAATKQLINEALESESAGFGVPAISPHGPSGAAQGGAQGAGSERRTIACPPHIVGRIIGRGGETIRSLQTASSAHIVINQNFPEGQPREVEISGPPDAVERGYGMIMDIINSEGSAKTQDVIVKHGQGITKIVECPKTSVGRIIGKGGETIKGLQKNYAASIQIEQNIVPCKVTISGQPAAVIAVERAILDLIEDRQPGSGGAGGYGGFHGAPQAGGFPPYGGAPGYGAPASGYPGYGAQPFAGGYNAPAPTGYPGYGQPQPYGGAPGYGAPAANPYGGAPAANPYGGAPAANPYGGAPAANPYGGGWPQQPQQPQQQPGAPPPPQPPPHASVWQEMKDDQGRSYYYNTQTGVSQWERPADM